MIQLHACGGGFIPNVLINMLFVCLSCETTVSRAMATTYILTDNTSSACLTGVE